MQKTFFTLIATILVILLVLASLYFVFQNFQNSPIFGPKIENSKNIVNQVVQDNKEFLKVEDLKHKGKQLNFSRLELAKTKTEQAKGMMNRTTKEACETCGMLFIFSEPAQQTFWMKDTLVPLKIIFLNTDGVIVNQYSAKPNQTDEVYPSNQEAQYVLEVIEDSILAKDLKIKDKLDINFLLNKGTSYQN